MMNPIFYYLVLFGVLTITCFDPEGLYAGGAKMSAYQHIPLFLTSSIMLNASTSGVFMAINCTVR